MKEELHFYTIDIKLIRTYAKIDDNVMSVSPQTGKQYRPFLGIIITQNNRKYCIPITSPKPKHYKMNSKKDIIKIFDTYKRDNNNQYVLIGILNLNNMIPISEEYIRKIDLRDNKNDNRDQRRYKGLLRKQINWCRDNEDLIIRKANVMYELITNTPDKYINLSRRTVNYKKLEEILDKRVNN